MIRYGKCRRCEREFELSLAMGKRAELRLCKPCFTGKANLLDKRPKKVPRCRKCGVAESRPEEVFICNDLCKNCRTLESRFGDAPIDEIVRIIVERGDRVSRPDRKARRGRKPASVKPRRLGAGVCKNDDCASKTSFPAGAHPLRSKLGFCPGCFENWMEAGHPK